MKLEAYVTNLGKYNEGELIGEWVTFPIDEEEENELMKRIGCAYEDEDGEIHNERYEEYFMTDYECEVNIFEKYGEYVNIETLNELAEQLEDIRDEDLFDALCEEYPFEDLEYIIDLYNSGNYIWWGNTTLLEVAMEKADEEMACLGIPDNAMKFVQRYFDYDAYEDYLENCGYREVGNGVLYVF